MRQLTPSELVFISKIMQMEAAELSVIKASLDLASDDQLKTTVKNYILNSESRLKGLQQFITENNIIPVMGGEQ